MSWAELTTNQGLVEGGPYPALDKVQLLGSASLCPPLCLPGSRGAPWALLHVILVPVECWGLSMTRWQRPLPWGRLTQLFSGLCLLNLGSCEAQSRAGLERPCRLATHSSDVMETSSTQQTLLPSRKIRVHREVPVLRNVIHPHPWQPGDGKDLPQEQGARPWAGSVAAEQSSGAHAAAASQGTTPFLGGDLAFMLFFISEATQVSPSSNSS